MKSHILFTWIKFLLIDSSLPDKKIWRKIIIWRWFDPHVRAEKIVFYFILIFCHFNFVWILVLLLTMRVVVFWKGLEVFKLLLTDVIDQYFLFFMIWSMRTSLRDIQKTIRAWWIWKSPRSQVFLKFWVINFLTVIWKIQI